MCYVTLVVFAAASRSRTGAKHDRVFAVAD